MSEIVLQINYKYHVSYDDYQAAAAPLAEPIAAVPGLLWKVWIVNKEEQEAGGIHLFADKNSLQAYLDSDLVAGFVSNPALSAFSVKRFSVMPAESQVTRAPIGALLA